LAGVGRRGEALALMGEAQELDDRLFEQLLDLASEQQRLQYVHAARGNLGMLLSLVSQHLSDSPGAVRAALDVVLRRKGMTAELLAAGRDGVLAGRHPELRREVEELTALRQRIARKTLAGPAADEPAEEYRRSLDGWKAEREERERRLS